MSLLRKLKREFIRFRINLRYSLNLKKPLLLLRIMKAYLSILLLNKMPLRYVDVAINYDCNLRCIHCSASKLRDESRERLTIDEYKKLAKELLNRGAVTIGFTGGEPTLDPRIKEIIRVFQPDRIMVSLVTNATTLNKEKIKEFKKMKVDILCVSLDSFLEEEHDRFRGVKGAYSSTMDAINTGLRNGLKVVVVATLTHQNIGSEGVRRLIELTKRLKLLLVFGLACPAGKWSKAKQYLLDENDIAYLNDLLGKYCHIRRDFDSNWLWNGCGAGKEKLYVTAYGDVIPCPFIHISFGNIRKEPLEVIRSRLLEIPEFRKYSGKCLSGEDWVFSRKYVVKANSQDNVPVYYKEIFRET